ncbi:aromatic amino acid transaminase [Tessaracoccus flavus]|uniref:Aminotransferase n=1 Tax=Tessaracoccus flavus TaxID=1610493 RepID=A0A1Q2CET3_9ACTN|nr:amino acid aminotransferase [Tessaracoccus flavus]AQP44580.1 aromatic amino acid aminotransferase [Tessaracoccus flavus]SDZ09250.1 aromatic-amino-acid transaminase [Tessaracoccus flavus]
MSLLDRAELAPADPILGLTEAYNSDDRPQKVNLGVGVYLDESGKVPLLDCVRTAQQRLAADAKPIGYLGIDGMPAYREAVRGLVFGEESAVLADGRVVTVQSLGGTGGLKVGADLLRQLHPSATVLISNPSWENHRALFTRAGFRVDSYRYYEPALKGIDVDAMLADLRSAEAGTIVLLHACCHNPTGYDLTPEQWDDVIAVLRERDLMPFLDMAYQGFGFGVEEDGAVVRKFVESGLSFFLATSFSKSFSLYGERIGSLSVVTGSADEAKRVLSQLKICIRTNYSNPPTQGAALVTTVLGDRELRATWESELAGMRDRIKKLRRKLVSGLEGRGIGDMCFIQEQLGMFSYSGLTSEQMIRLRQEFGIYGTDAGRMCVAALNDRNVDYVADAIAAVRH